MSDMTGPVFNVFQRGGELELGGELHHEAVPLGVGLGEGEGRKEVGEDMWKTVPHPMGVWRCATPLGRFSQPAPCICKKIFLT